MIPSDKQIASLIKKVQKKVEQKPKKEAVVKREVLDEEPSLEIFNEMKKKPHTT